MANDDEKTVMFNADAPKKGRTAPLPIQSRSQASVDPGDEKTVMFGAAMHDQGEGQDDDIHSAKTLMSDGSEGLPDWAQKAALPKAAARATAPAARRGGGFLSVLGGLGLFLGFLGLGTDILPLLNGAEDWMQQATLAFGAGAMLLVGLGFFGTLRKTNFLGAIVGLLALVAAGARGVMVQPFLEGDLAQIVAFAAIVGPAAVYVFVAIWAFTATGAVGGGLGVTTGILLLLGGGAVVAYYTLVQLGVLDWQADLSVAIMFGGSGLAAIGCITGGIAVIKTA